MLRWIWNTAILLTFFALPLCAADYGRIPKERGDFISQLPSGIEKMGSSTLPWRLFVPQKSNKKCPLVVFFHGAGRRGDDNIGAMELAWNFISPEAQANNPCFVLAAQVPMGKRWVDHNWNQGSYTLKDVKISDHMKLALELVRTTIQSQNIDPQRVYSVGQSMGGFGSWDAMLRAPELWAAGTPICGGGSPQDAASIKNISIWAWHGENDTIIPVTATREMIDALQKAGSKPRYTEIPKGGHGVWGKAFENPEYYTWLFAQKK